MATKSPVKSAAKSVGQDRLKSASQDLFSALSNKAVGAVGDRVSDWTERLEDVASGNTSLKAALGSGKAAASGESPLKGALKGAASSVKDKIPGLGGGSGKSSGSPKATKATNIIEDTDVGVPVHVAYNQWTEFGGFPSFMKKVEKVDAAEDEKLEWKAQIVWSHRHWSATILEQIPDERIVWRSQGEKGHVDGAVTFHELGPNLTRILVVLEYYPQGLFERTGNIWRAQGRRARVELKHFRRHVMTRTILDPDEVEGWRGRIEDSEVVETHEEALEREEQEQDEYEDEAPEDEAPEDEYDEGEEPEESEEEAPEDEYEEAEEPEESEEEVPEDEYEEGEEPEESEEEVPEDEYEESEEEVPEEAEEEAPEDEYEEAEEPEESEEEVPEDEYDEADVAEDEEPEEEEEPPARSRRRRAS